MKQNRRKMGHSKRRGGQREDVEDWSLKRQKSKSGVSPGAARADGKTARERQRSRVGVLCLRC